MATTEPSAARYNRPWRYALGMFGITIPGNMYATYATYFYNDKLGLSLALISLGSVLFAVWDAFNDPIAGYLSDRTRTSAGRRRPWLMIGAPVFALAFILFFSPPGFLGVGTALAVYFTVFLMLTETVNTILTVNYHSLLPELFREVGGRNSANALRQALQLVGLIIGVSLVPMVADAITYRWTALLLGFIGMGLLAYSVAGCRERREFSASPQPGLWTSLKAVFVNLNFWLVSASHFFYQATTGLLLASIPFFVKYTLGLADGMATVVTGAVFVSAIPSMYLWYRLIRHFGTLKVWRGALLWLGLSFIPMMFARTLMPAALCGTLIGIGIAGVTANLDMINSELIEADARRCGLRREGIFFSSISFVTRLSGLIRSGVFMLVFVIFGFESGANPGANPALAAWTMMLVFPLALMAFSFTISLFVRFGTNPGKEAPENGL